MRQGYPRSVHDIIDDQMTFTPAAIRAVMAFARSRPWQGELDERHQKFRRLHESLCEAYVITPRPRLIFGNDHSTCSGRSCFIPAANAIVLRGRLSVITYLHEFAHARGVASERRACKWSLNLFRRCFPKSWRRLTFEGHMARAHAAQE